MRPLEPFEARTIDAFGKGSSNVCAQFVGESYAETVQVSLQMFLVQVLGLRCIRLILWA